MSTTPSIERHADPIDEACALEAAQTAAAIAAVRDANKPETHPDFDGQNCVACDNPIPAGRLANGRIRCVSCQGALEHKNKQFSRGQGRNSDWL